MKNIKVAINGFGRIGRLVFRVLVKTQGVEVVAINDLTDTTTLAHLLKYDSIHGRFDGTVSHDKENLIVNGKSIRVLAVKDPATLPWKDMGVDTVVESTGFFTDEAKASLHLQAGAKKVIISAPGKGDKIKTVVLGVNSEILKQGDTLLSNASCTTNCLAPMIKVLEDNYGIDRAFVTTIHAYTSDQRLHDAPHSDLRRARAAAVSIIPTSTNAGVALGTVIPSTKGKIKSAALRVPVIDGSLTEVNAILNKETTVEALNAAFKAASEKGLKGILEYTEDPIVSVDIIGNTHSCILDGLRTEVTGNFVKITGWYDNECGYSNRLAELVSHVRDL